MRILTALHTKDAMSCIAVRSMTVLGTTILMTSASACTAHNTVAQGDIALLCSADGTKLLNPAMTSEAVCGIFKAKIDDALLRRTVAIQSASEAASSDWIKLTVRFSKPGTASAMVVLSTAGKETTHPEIAVDVMDKFMGPDDVGTLASAVAKYLAETKKR